MTTVLQENDIKSCDLYIADHQLQTSILGELHLVIKANIVSPEKQYLELGSVISSKSKGRSSKKDITVCDLTGKGAQDTAITRNTYEEMMKKNLGMKLN
jgi:ornithine cyclodeaminase